MLRGGRTSPTGASLIVDGSSQSRDLFEAIVFYFAVESAFAYLEFACRFLAASVVALEGAANGLAFGLFDADIAAWQTRFAGSVTLWVSYPDALCTAATDALGTTGMSLGMENLLVTSSAALDADSRAALEQAAADAGVQHIVVHDTAAFR